MSVFAASTSGSNSQPSADGSMMAAAGTITLVAFASPFIAVAAVNGLVYGAPLISSPNAFIPCAMIGGNVIFPGVGGFAGGVLAATYQAGYPLTRALVIGVGAGVAEIAIGMALVEIWMKGGSK
jgi:hypothetical protein